MNRTALFVLFALGLTSNVVAQTCDEDILEVAAATNALTLYGKLCLGQENPLSDECQLAMKASNRVTKEHLQRVNQCVRMEQVSLPIALVAQRSLGDALPVMEAMEQKFKLALGR